MPNPKTTDPPSLPKAQHSPTPEGLTTRTYVTYAVAEASVAAVVGLPERSVWVEAMVAGFLAGLQRSYQGCQLTRFRAALCAKCSKYSSFSADGLRMAKRAGKAGGLAALGPLKEPLLGRCGAV